MSDLLPLFPLPNVVLFPNVFLPLHIFEPRYREMVAAAEAGDRMIGMVLLQPGWEGHYEGRPPVYPIGCSGVMTHVERLNDGRYNLVLRGVERFRIVSEDVSEDEARSYRRAIVEPLVEPPLAADARQAIRGCRSKLESLLAPTTERAAELRRRRAARTAREPAKRRSRRRWPTRIWCTRWRNTSTSSQSKSRRCSNRPACARAPSRSWSCSR